jgi:hypothetical protein
MLKANPVFGVGFGRFLDFHYKVAHNSIVHTFAELGLFGAFFLVGAYYGFFRATRLPGRSGVSDSEALHWSRTLSVSAIGAMACGFFLSRQYIVVPYILLAMGLSSVTMVVPDGHWVNTPLQILVVGLLTASSVVIVWISVRTLGAW